MVRFLIGNAFGSAELIIGTCFLDWSPPFDLNVKRCKDKNNMGLALIRRNIVLKIKSSCIYFSSFYTIKIEIMGN